MSDNVSPKICVAFDLDDTLFKERHYVETGRRTVAREMTVLSGVPAEELMKVMTEADDAFDALRERLSTTLAAGADIDTYLDIYRAHIPVLTLSDDVRAGLEALKKAGVTLGIITDGRHVTQWNKIRALGLDRIVDNRYILVSGDLGYDKQTPGPFEELDRRVQTDRYIYVGDNLTKDFHYPRKLGWTAVMLRDNGENIHRQNIDATPADYRPDIIIDDFRDLVNYISI